MEAIVDQPFGDVAGLDTLLRLPAIAEDHLVQRGRAVGQLVHILKVLADVVSVQHRVFGGLPQAVRAIGHDVSQGADEHAEVAVEHAHPADGLGRS